MNHTKYDDISTSEVTSLEVTLGLLGLVLTSSEMPPVELVENLSDIEREAIANWAADVHAEASDNDVEASAAPEALRRILSPDHYLQRWRVD